MRLDNLAAILVLSAALLAVHACGPGESGPDDAAIAEAAYAALVADSAQPSAPADSASPAEFIEHAASREARGRDGWYILARRDVPEGPVVQMIIADSHPASVTEEAGRQRVIFKTRSGGTLSFADTTGLIMISDSPGGSPMQMRGLPALTGDPVLAYQEALRTDPQLPLAEFIATDKQLSLIPGITRFFNLR